MFVLLGRFAYRHGWWVIAGWLVVLVAGVLLGPSVFGRLEDNVGAQKTVESVEVQRQLAEFGGVDTDVWILLDGMAVSDPRLRDSVAALTRDLRVMPDVRAVGPDSAGPDVSPDAGSGWCPVSGSYAYDGDSVPYG